jgi:membrane-associated phospholipid phosphatase
MNQLLYVLIISSFFSYCQSVVFAQSPYSLNTKRETIIFGVGLGIGITDYVMINNTGPILETLSRENINSFDRGAAYNWSPSAGKWSDVLLTTSILSPLLLFSSSAIRDDIGTFSVMYLQNLITAYSITHLAKATVRRYRPFVYNEETPLESRVNPDAKLSFFSGHTSMSFASAVFLSTTFSKYNPDSKLKPFVWGSSLIIAATVGYLRYSYGAHFPTDIITGAIVGSLAGFIILLIHEKDEQNRSEIPLGNPYNDVISISIIF